MSIRKQTTRIVAIPAILVAFFVGALAAHAGETLVGKVPFEFTMGDTTFPAGEYQFQVDQPSSNTVLVRSMDSPTTAMALSRRAGDAVREEAPFMKFNVYGEKKFLSMIQTSKGTAVALGRGSQERALAKVQGASSVALVRPSDLRKARS